MVYTWKTPSFYILYPSYLLRPDTAEHSQIIPLFHSLSFCISPSTMAYSRKILSPLLSILPVFLCTVAYSWKILCTHITQSSCFSPTPLIAEKYSSLIPGRYFPMTLSSLPVSPTPFINSFLEDTICTQHPSFLSPSHQLRLVPGRYHSTNASILIVPHNPCTVVHF